MPDAGIAFEIIRTVTRTILESRDIQPALDAVTRLISEKMRVQVCSIYLFDHASGRLRLAAGHGLNRGVLAEVSLGVDEGLTGAVYSSGEIINIAHPQKDPRFRFFPGLGEENLESFLGISIAPGVRHGDGVLILQGVEPVPFRTTVEDLAYTLAAQLATLLESRQRVSRAPKTAHSGAPAPAQIVAPPFVRAQTAFGGIADGIVTVLQTQQVWETVFFSESDDPQGELALLERGLERARKESRRLRQRAGEIFAEIDARIFETHEQFLADEDYLGMIRAHIREKRTTAVFAVKVATREMSRRFQESGVPMLASRAADLRDVGLRLLNALGEATRRIEPHNGGEQGVIVAALELLPSDLVYLQSRRILGILCETGGSTSHAAILARSLDVPCFIGIPGLTRFLASGTRVILDGTSGLVYIHPDAHVVREYQRLMSLARARASGQPRADVDRTHDGHEVQISGNVSLLSDLNLMSRFSIRSVGLYRSEFFFMIRNSFPDEDTQFAVYRQVMERCGAHGVTFRLLDVGGDKPLRYFDWGREENPSLGWRSIRMLLQRPEILTPHLRALLRAAQLGDMRLVLPMISTLHELRELKSQLRAAARDLEREKGKSLRMPPVGIMIEIPSTVIQVEAFLAECDFLCLGTNDLIQYLFAIDRGNERVADYHHPFHPAFLHALRRVSDAARAAGKPVTVCGEMAGDPVAVPILLGLGLNALSIAPGSADTVRATLERVEMAECRALVDHLLTLSSADEVRAAAEGFLERRPQVQAAG
ncbi:MAG TPA: phosphoenolpyruvate--protein phosphotransferase [Fibrobacteria bacterium]|nr:phosphoenolpyruvate--protein phosphotransferase [Fibrobacteria bacterium]